MERSKSLTMLTKDVAPEDEGISVKERFMMTILCQSVVDKEAQVVAVEVMRRSRNGYGQGC